MAFSHRFLPLLARLLVGIPFTLGGLAKLFDYSGTVGLITETGLPFAPMGWLMAVLVEAGCGFLLILGFQTRAAAVVLALFTMATAVVFHSNLADPMQLPHFLKNLMITGGLLQVAAFGAGALSLDARSRARVAPV